VHVLVKDFKDYQSLLSCKDYQCHLPFTFQRLSESFVLQRLSMSSALYFSKTIRFFCLVEIINVICPLFFKTITVLFTFQRLQCLLSRLSQSSLHFKDFNVFFQNYHSLLYIYKTIRVLCHDYHSLLYFSKTIKVCYLMETIDVFCSLHFQKLSESFVSKTIRVFCQDFGVSFTFQNFKVFCLMYLIPLTFFLSIGFTAWVSASARSDGKIARMKLVSLSLLTFSFSIKR